MIKIQVKIRYDIILTLLLGAGFETANSMTSLWGAGLVRENPSKHGLHWGLGSPIVPSERKVGLNFGVVN